MTDTEIAKHLDGKQYGTIRSRMAGREALLRMLRVMDRIGRERFESNPTILYAALDLERGLLKDGGVWREIEDLEIAVAELDHAGYPETAREFADVLRQMRALDHGTRHLPWASGQ